MSAGQRPVQLMHKVCLIGAKAPYNFFHLILNPATEGKATKAMQSRFIVCISHLLDLRAGIWYMICYSLLANAIHIW